MINTVAALFITIAMIAAPEANAQSRRSSGGASTATRSSSSQTTSRGSSSMSSRSGGSSTANRSANISTSSSRSASPQNDRTSRSTGSSTTSRSSGSSSSAATTSRSTGSSTTSRSVAPQNDRTNRSTGSSTSSRSTGSSSAATTSRSTGSSTSSRSVAPQNDRTNRSTGSSTTSRSTGSSSSATTSRSTGTSTSRSTGSVDQNNRTSRSTGTSTSRSTGTTTRSTGTTDRTAGTSVRSSSNVSRSGLGNNAAREANASASVNNAEPMRDHAGNYRYNDDFRLDNGHNMHRVPPRERDFIAWDRPGLGYFWDHRPHYFGYRVHVLPPHYRRITHWGIDYYFYEGIYYRPYGGVYVICRPPFGTPLERAIDRALFNLVKFSYYCNTYRTYSTVFDNYNVIAQQNLIIAQNNARIAAQNASYALNSGRALSAYELANKLGLVQSYAYANSDYFYQDGVFYSVSASGNYTTIVPPAGALVSSLPDDYETIVLNGVEYYMVDNTVYRTTLFDGQPYLEVLGQMYGSLYNQYSIYR